MIPACLILTSAQRAKFDAWAATQKKPTIEEHDEMMGGACMTSMYEFTCYETGLGFNLNVRNVYTKQSISLLTEEDIENA